MVDDAKRTTMINNFDVVIIGSCNYDFLNFVERFPSIGETIKCSNFLTALGGKGSNQAVQCAKLGAKVAMVGKVGNDSFGSEILQNFAKLGINCDHVKQVNNKDCSTGTATVVVSKSDGRNFIIINSGANGQITRSDVDACENLIKNCKVLLCQLEIPIEVVKYAFKLAKKHNVCTILNPAPALPNLDKELFQNVDILCPNESETEILTGIKLECSSKAPNNVNEALELLFNLNREALKLVVITMGEQGCYYAQNTNPPIQHHVAAEKVQPVDTTGAGDSFLGALAFYAALYPKLPVMEKIRRSTLIATKSVLKQGAQTSYADKTELDSNLF